MSETQPRQKSRVSTIVQNSERGSPEVGNAGNDPITMKALWGKMVTMADVNKRQIEAPTEVISNLAANVLAMQDSLKGNKKTAA